MTQWSSKMVYTLYGCADHFKRPRGLPSTECRFLTFFTYFSRIPGPAEGWETGEGLGRGVQGSVTSLPGGRRKSDSKMGRAKCAEFALKTPQTPPNSYTKLWPFSYFFQKQPILSTFSAKYFSKLCPKM